MTVKMDSTAQNDNPAFVTQLMRLYAEHMEYVMMDMKGQEHVCVKIRNCSHLCFVNQLLESQLWKKRKILICFFWLF
jgi:hypothetical protein